VRSATPEAVNTLNVLHWNANGLTDIRLTMAAGTIEEMHVLAITETKRNDEIYMNGGDWMQSHTHGLEETKNGGWKRGTKFFWRRYLGLRPIYGERIAALSGDDVLVIAVYVEPKMSVAEFKELLDETTKLLRKHKRKRVLIGGDYNSPRGSVRRRHLDEWARRSRLTHVQKRNTYVRHGKWSQLDVILVPEAERDDTTTSLRELYSDHRGVVSEMRNVNITRAKPTQQPRLDRKRLRALEERVKRRAHELHRTIHDERLDADETIERFEEALLEMATHNGAADTTKRRRMDGVEKSKKLCELRQRFFKLRKTRMKLKKQHQRRLLSKEKRVLADIKREIRECRERRLKEFAEKVNRKPGLLFRMRKKTDRKKHRPALEAQTLANHFRREDELLAAEERKIDGERMPVMHGDLDYEYKRPCAAEVRLLNAPIEEHEVATAVRNSAPNKAPGRCRVTAALLRSGGPTLWRLLTQLYNRYWLRHDYPCHFRDGVVTAILKPSKSPYDTKSYRPITLLCVVWKVFEKVINRRLALFLQSRTHPEQGGFKQGRSTTQQIYTLQHAYATYGNEATVLLLDASAAFDRISRKAAVEEARRRGVSDGIERDGRHFESWLMSNLTRSSTRTVRIGEQTSRPYELRCGTPQGSVTSPTIFTLCADRLLLRARLYLRRAGRLNDALVCGFADDIALVARNPKLCEEVAEQMHDEAKSVNLSFNPLKTQLLSRLDNAIVTFGGVQIRGRSEATYLGANITRSGHTTKTLLKAKLRQRIGQIDWLLHRENLSLTVKARMIHSGILPAVLYACAVSWFTPAAIREMDSMVMSEVNKAVSAKGQFGGAHDILRNELGILPVTAYLSAQRKAFVAKHLFDAAPDNVRFDLDDDRSTKQLSEPTQRIEHFHVTSLRRPEIRQLRRARRAASEPLEAHETWREEVRAAAAEAHDIVSKAMCDHNYGGRHGDTIRRHRAGEVTASRRDYAHAIAKLIAKETMEKERAGFLAALEESKRRPRTLERYTESGRHEWPGRGRGALPAYLDSPAAGMILCMRAERLPMELNDEKANRMSDYCPMCGDTLTPEGRNAHFVLECVEMMDEWSDTRAAARRLRKHIGDQRLMEMMLRLERQHDPYDSDHRRITRAFEKELPKAYVKWMRAVMMKRRNDDGDADDNAEDDTE